MLSWRPWRRTLVLTHTVDEDGEMYRAVTLGVLGALTIVGHDLGPGVEQFFGCREYEFTRRLTRAETSALRRLLGVARRRDLLAAVGERFASISELEELLTRHDLAGTFWNRLGG